jgi:hypothetical protein
MHTNLRMVFDLKVTQTAIGWFSWGLMRSSWNLNTLIFTEGRKTREPGEKPLNQGREPTNNS